MLRRPFSPSILLLLAARRHLRRALRAARDRRPRDPAARQLGHAGGQRHPRRRRRHRCAVGALRRLAHRPAPGLPGALGQDAQCADQPGAEPARFGRSTRSSARSTSSARRSGPIATSPILGVLFDRARAAPFLGVEGGEVQRSVADAPDPGHGHRRDRDQRRASQRVAAGLGAVPHLAKPDRLCPGQRHGRRPDAGQRGADRAAGPRLVAQHHRYATAPRTSWSPRSSSSALYPGRAGAGAVHRPPRPGQ